MTKIEIISQVAEVTGLTKVKAEEVVETIMRIVKDTLGEGEAVILRRFGSFRVHRKSDRIGRNPKTGEEAPIAARKVVRFKAGRHFKEAVNRGQAASSFEI
ncbi:MAG: HU family DNA-binding protein [Nitrospinota bacterium]